MAEWTDNEPMAEMMLKTVSRITGGSVQHNVSMWTVGEELGLDRSKTEDLAMELVSEGLLEIKNLSGGIGLTEAGLEKLKESGPVSDFPVAENLDDLIKRLESTADEPGLPDAERGDLKIDLESLNIQLRRSKKSPEVINALLKVVSRILADSNQADLAEKVRSFID